VLLDADVVIRLFELGLWDKLVERTRVTLAQTVYDQAAHYFNPETQARKHIDLQPYRDENRIDIIDSDVTETAPILAKCGKHALLHEGELESIACVARPNTDALFCTADGGAIRTMVLLDLNDRVVSLEELLRRTNLARSFDDRDSEQFSEKKLQYWLTQASIYKIQYFKP
jgi:hypothetical protein